MMQQPPLFLGYSMLLVELGQIESVSVANSLFFLWYFMLLVELGQIKNVNVTNFSVPFQVLIDGNDEDAFR